MDEKSYIIMDMYIHMERYYSILPSGVLSHLLFTFDEL